MRKDKLNIITDPSTFVGSSCFSFRPTLFEWNHVNEYTEDAPMVLFDDTIRSVLFIPTNNKMIFGWLGESSEVIPKLIDDILTKKDLYKSKLKCIFTHDYRLINKDPIFFQYNPPASNMPWVLDQGIHQKTKLCSYITSLKYWTPGHKIRVKMLEHMLRNNLHVDSIYGRGHNEIEKKEIGLNDYMFSVVIENGFYGKYYTEKVMDAFVTGTIPIYLGHRSILEDFDENGIIFLDRDGPIDYDIVNKLSEDDYYSRLESVKTNYEIARKVKISDDMIYEKIQNYD